MTTISIVPNFNFGELQLVQQATSQTLVSQAFPESQALGTGTIVVVLNPNLVGASNQIDVPIDSSNNTISGVSDAINLAASQNGLAILATTLTGSDGIHLVLQSQTTGFENSINVSVALGTDTGISQLVVGSASTTNSNGYPVTTGDTTSTMTQTAAAQDAVFLIAGIPVVSPSNTATNVIPGFSIVIA